jgi:hypothetical protein
MIIKKVRIGSVNLNSIAEKTCTPHQDTKKEIGSNFGITEIEPR